MATKSDRPVKKKGRAEKELEAAPKFQLSRVKEFAADVKSEFGKIVWPDKKQTMGSTAVVVVFVIMISFYLGAVDLLLGKMIRFILK